MYVIRDRSVIMTTRIVEMRNPTPFMAYAGGELDRLPSRVIETRTMKNAAILIFAAFAGIAIAGDPPKLEKLTLKNGRDYEKVTVTEKRPDGISISHDSGTARIKFEDLPEDVAAKLGGFNADDAAATRKKADAEEAATIAEIDKGLAAQKVVGNSNIGKPLDYFKDKYGKPIALEKNVASFTKAGVYIMVIFMDEKAVRLVYSKGLDPLPKIISETLIKDWYDRLNHSILANRSTSPASNSRYLHAR